MALLVIVGSIGLSNLTETLKNKLSVCMIFAKWNPLVGHIHPVQIHASVIFRT